MLRRLGPLLLVAPAIALALGAASAAAQSPPGPAANGSATITTELHPGWNLVGWIGPDTPVADLFEEIPALQLVSARDAHADRYVRARRGDGSPPGSLRLLTPGMGLWLWIGGDEPVAWARPAEAAGVLLQLQRGLNLAAWSGGPGSLEDALAGFGAALSSVHRWNAETQRYESYVRGVASAAGRAGCDRPRRRAVDLPLLAGSLVATGRGRSADGVRRGRGRRHGVRPRRGVPRPQRPPRRALRGPRWHRTHRLHPRRCRDAARGLRGALRAGARRGPLPLLVRGGDRLRRVVRRAVRIDRRAGVHRAPARQGRAVGRTPGGGRRLQQARPAVAPPRHSRVRERALPGRDRQRGVRAAADRADRPGAQNHRCR